MLVYKTDGFWKILFMTIYSTRCGLQVMTFTSEVQLILIIIHKDRYFAWSSV